MAVSAYLYCGTGVQSISWEWWKGGKRAAASTTYSNSAPGEQIISDGFTSGYIVFTDIVLKSGYDEGTLTWVYNTSSGSSSYKYGYNWDDCTMDASTYTRYGHWQADKTPTPSMVEINLKCGEGISSYDVMGGSRTRRITSQSDYETFDVSQGTQLSLTNIQWEDGYSGIKWWYNSSASYNYPNRSTTSPNYELDTSYDRWGYFEATSYSPPTYTYYYRARLYIDGALSKYVDDTVDSPASTGYNFQLSTVQNMFDIPSNVSFVSASEGNSYCTYSAGYFSISSSSVYSAYRAYMDLYYETDEYTYTYQYSKNAGSDTVTNMPDSPQRETSERTRYSMEIPYNVPRRTGYAFTGWNTKSSGSGTDYAPGDTGPTLTKDNASITLYAQWEVQTYQMSATYDTGYSAAFTSISVSPKTVNYGGSATFTAVMATGYNFTGWYDASGNLVSSSQTYTARNITSYLSLYARGTRKKYTVSAEIYSGYGTAISSASVDKGEVAYGDTVTFTASVKSGFTFRGWYDTSGNLVSASASYSPAIYNNTALYAKANVVWTYSKSRGSRTITAEEWKRLQSFIKGLRSSTSFVYSPTAGDTLSKEMYDEVYRVFGKGDRGIIKKKTPVYASYLNDLISEANNL